MTLKIRTSAPSLVTTSPVRSIASTAKSSPAAGSPPPARLAVLFTIITSLFRCSATRGCRGPGRASLVVSQSLVVTSALWSALVSAGVSSHSACSSRSKTSASSPGPLSACSSESR